MSPNKKQLAYHIAKRKRMQKQPLANLATVETERVFRIEIPQEGMRADKFLQKRLHWQSRAQIQTVFEEGRVTRNGADCAPGKKLKRGDKVVLKLPPPHEDVAEMARIPYEVVFEDEVMLVVSKPPHLIVHPTGGYRYTTLLNALHLKYRHDDPARDVAPRLVNRIDKETSGLVLCGKNSKITGRLGIALEKKEVEKDYLALVEGSLEADHQVIDLPIAQDQDAEVAMLRRIDKEAGQPSKTEVWVEERLGRFTLLRCRLHTGRMHQIRVHLRAIGHPLVCDRHYGLRDELRASDLRDPPPTPTRTESPYGYREGDSDADVSDRIRAVDTAKRHEYEAICRGERVPRGEDDRLLLGRCALHAYRLRFVHPVSSEQVELVAPLPRDMEGAINEIRARAT